MEAGTTPWRREWDASTGGHHLNLLTGHRYHEIGRVRDTIASTFAQPSIDQVVAQRWWSNPSTRARYRSLEVGVCRFTGTDGVPARPAPPLGGNSTCCCCKPRAS
jgi:hypothetical protein